MADDFALKISANKKVDENHYIFVLSNFLPIPETQAEQLVKLLNKNKSITFFSGYEIEDIEKFKNVLKGFKIDSEIVEI